uniref:Uncharacterized protein n=1 Tax=Leersia perrieri TaxID=77586 RepID=A0A0D9WZ54_9ORYZ
MSSRCFAKLLQTVEFLTTVRHNHPTRVKCGGASNPRKCVVGIYTVGATPVLSCHHQRPAFPLKPPKNLN